MNASTLLVGLILLGAPQDPVVIRVARPTLQQDTIVGGGVQGTVEAAPPVLSSEMILQDGEMLAEDGMSISDMNFGGCDSCCGTCNECCRPSLMLFDLRHPPRNMIPHLPYDAQPKTYYYFRPYNWMHIHQHQGDAAAWEASPGNPYSNKVFKDLYRMIEAEGLEEIQSDPVVPPPVEDTQSGDDS